MSVLEDLDESECYLYALITDKSGIDLAEFSLTDDSNPSGDGCFRAWPFQWPWWRNEDKFQLDQGSRCIQEGTLVLSENGWKPIEAIEVGERVLTHRNRWRRVTEVFDQGIKPVVAIDAHGHFSSLNVTKNHKLWAREVRRASKPKDGHKGKKFADPAWIAAEEWKWSDGSQQITTHISSPAKNIEALRFERFLEPAYRSGPQNHLVDLLNEDWLWLTGLFVAEGTSYVGSNSYAKWSIHEDEVVDVTSRFDRLGLNYCVIPNPKDKGVCIQMHGKSLVQWLEETAGKGCRNKKIAPWVYGLDENYRKAFFDGLIYGDGWVRPTGRVDYSTTSKELVFGLKILAQSLGYSFSVTESQGGKVWIQDHWANAGISYSISMQKLSEQKNAWVSIIDDHAWSTVYSMKEAGLAHVWDLEVEEDHSFVAEGVVCHNSLGKSLGIKIRSYAFPFNYPGQEMVITAPEGIHLDAITDIVETAFMNNRLGREMLVNSRSGIKHRPFHMNFDNGARIMGRIPQRDGKGLKGTHPIMLELDEGQDFPEPGYSEIIETLKQGFEGAIWRIHGVTRGVVGKFYEFSKEDSGWTVHHLPAMFRPTWSDEERAEKIQMYGSRNSPDYRRNVLGMHGDSTSPLVNLYALMACVKEVPMDRDRNIKDDHPDAIYNFDEYFSKTINNEQIEEVGDVSLLLDFPRVHKSKWKNFWIGMDVGYCVDEATEILTRRGWLKYDQLQEGDESLSIDPETGKSTWSKIEELHIFDSIPGGREMIHMKGESFDALTTPNHRWLVKPESNKWRWKTTETLNTKDGIPLNVKRGDLPKQKTYSDDFVELVAWYTTEGCLKRGNGIEISQSIAKNPMYVDRIHNLLQRLFGEPGRMAGGWTQYKWSYKDRFNGTMRYWTLSNKVTQDILDVCVGEEKVTSIEFLSKLTKDQLDLYILTCERGDGWINDAGNITIEQKSEDRIKSFEAACILAGYAVSTCFDPVDKIWHSNIRSRNIVRPRSAEQQAIRNGVTSKSMKFEKVDYNGIVWCPTLKHQNWLARRNGSTYFTGNTVSPSAIVVFGEEKGKDGKTALRLLTRVLLERVSNPNQVDAILHFLTFYRPVGFSMDKHGIGLPLFQEIQGVVEKNSGLRPVLDMIKGYSFSEKILVDFDQSVPFDEDRPRKKEERAKEAGVYRNTLEYSSDKVRQMFDEKRYILPFDRELIGEIQGQTVSVEKGKMDMYGRRRSFSKGNVHSLDAMKMATLGFAQFEIEAMMKEEDRHDDPGIIIIG